MSGVVEHLIPAECGLLVVDIQDRLMRVINEKERVVKNGVMLIKAAQVLDIPIVATTQYVARIGDLLPEIREALDCVVSQDKLEFSCFNNQDACSSIQEFDQVKTWIVCGVETHICVYQTVVDAIRSGYHVWVASDGVSSRTPENYQNGLDRIKEIGGVVANTEMIIYDLLGRAGTPEFKALLPLLK
ncbi:isochorismatase family protein [Thermodesulfobacteriota bacterium]